jgi:hypothetical protein
MNTCTLNQARNCLRMNAPWKVAVPRQSKSLRPSHNDSTYRSTSSSVPHAWQRGFASSSSNASSWSDRCNQHIIRR